MRDVILVLTNYLHCGRFFIFMAIIKRTKDQLAKMLLGTSTVPRGLFELQDYFRHHGSIEFKNDIGKDGTIIARSSNFLYGSIITSGKTQEELDTNIKDAILTSFSIPSSYAVEAKIIKEGTKEETYALA